MIKHVAAQKSHSFNRYGNCANVINKGLTLNRSCERHVQPSFLLLMVTWQPLKLLIVLWLRNSAVFHSHRFHCSQLKCTRLYSNLNSAYKPQSFQYHVANQAMRTILPLQVTRMVTTHIAHLRQERLDQRDSTSRPNSRKLSWLNYSYFSEAHPYAFL